MYFTYKDVKYEVPETTEQMQKSPATIQLPSGEFVEITEWVSNRPWKVLPHTPATPVNADAQPAATPTRTVVAIAASFIEAEAKFKIHSQMEELTKGPLYCKMHMDDILCHTQSAFHQEILREVAAPALWNSLKVMGYKIVGFISPHQVIFKVAVKSITRLKKRKVQH